MLPRSAALSRPVDWSSNKGHLDLAEDLHGARSVSGGGRSRLRGPGAPHQEEPRLGRLPGQRSASIACGEGRSSRRSAIGEVVSRPREADYGNVDPLFHTGRRSACPLPRQGRQCTSGGGFADHVCAHDGQGPRAVTKALGAKGPLRAPVGHVGVGEQIARWIPRLVSKCPTTAGRQQRSSEPGRSG